MAEVGLNVSLLPTGGLHVLAPIARVKTCYEYAKSPACDFCHSLTATLTPVACPYSDPVEILTGPIPAQSPFIPADAKVVVGAVAPASPDPIPIVVLPGFEYRMSEWRHPETGEIHWRLERRKAAQYGRRRVALMSSAPRGDRTQIAALVMV